MRPTGRSTPLACSIAVATLCVKVVVGSTTTADYTSVAGPLLLLLGLLVGFAAGRHTARWTCPPVPGRLFLDAATKLRRRSCHTTLRLLCLATGVAIRVAAAALNRIAAGLLTAAADTGTLLGDGAQKHTYTTISSRAPPEMHAPGALVAPAAAPVLPGAPKQAVWSAATACKAETVLPDAAGTLIPLHISLEQVGGWCSNSCEMPSGNSSSSVPPTGQDTLLVRHSSLDAASNHGSFAGDPSSSEACSSNRSSLERASAPGNQPFGPGWTKVLSLSAVTPAAQQQGSGHQQDCIAATEEPAEDTIKLGVLLGAGSFGKVYRGMQAGRQVAVKVLHHFGTQAAMKVACEAGLMLKANHPNVVKAHHVIMWQRSLASCSDFGGSTYSSTSGSGGSGASSCPASDLNFTANLGASGGSGGMLTNRSLGSDLSVNSSSLCSVLIENDDSCELGKDDDDDGPESQTWIVQEYCDAGTLDDAAREGRLADRDQQLSSLLDVARGMQYLHDSNMLHGDLKAGNVCLLKCPTSASSWLNATGRSNTSPANNFTCKVADFSMTRALDAGKTHCTTTSLGTISHMAPEVVLTGKQTKPGDVYAFGMLIWEVLQGRSPFSDCRHEAEILERVAVKQQRPAWDQTLNLHPELVGLAEECWSRDPTRRPTFAAVCKRLQLLQHELQWQHVEEAATAAAAAECSRWSWDSGNGPTAGRATGSCALSSSCASSTAWLSETEEDEMLKRELMISSGTTAAGASGASSAGEVLARSSSFRGGKSSSSSSSVLKPVLASPQLRGAVLRATPVGSVSLGTSSLRRASTDLHPITEEPSMLLGTASGGSGASHSGERGLDVLHQGDQGLMSTLGKARQLSSSGGVFGSGVDAAAGGVWGVAVGTSRALTGEKLSAVSGGASKLLETAAGSSGGRSGARKLEPGHEDGATWVEADTSVELLLGRLHQRQQEHDNAAKALADAGPADGPHSGYW